jgi:hypothetical protein
MKTPTAFEWHNYETGHCYVDYVPHQGMDEKDGYTKMPLYLESQFTIEVTDEEIDKQFPCKLVCSGGALYQRNIGAKWMRDTIKLKLKNMT